MNTNRAHAVILMVDDDPDDYYLAKDALEESGVQAELLLVADGEELFDYLRNREKFKNPQQYPRPGVILLDLNMPVKSGREVLAAVKADAALKDIPVVIYTTSREREDILACYGLGANAYISKPASFQGMVETMGTLARYWLDITTLPAMEAASCPVEKPLMAS